MSKIAVLACPHSGTSYIARVFWTIGLDVGHENNAHADGNVSWGMGHWTAERLESQGFSILLHQLRHPLMAISAFSRVFPQRWEVFSRMALQRDIEWSPDEESEMIRGMHLWLYWNRFAAETASLTYRIEDLPTSWPTILETIGREADTPLPQVSTSENRDRTLAKIYSKAGSSREDPDVSVQVIASTDRPKKPGESPQLSFQVTASTSCRKRVADGRKVIYSWDELYTESPELTLQVLELAKIYGYTQLPYHYLRDPFYNFPEQILLTLEKSPCS